MKIFRCGHCAQPVFFENVRCLRCGRPLAYLPLPGTLASLEPDGKGGWRPSPVVESNRVSYRLCANYDRENVCNWGVPADDPDPLCRSCRLTRVIPDLSQPGAKEAWYRIEVAKRRLVYGLIELGLPLASKRDEPERGLAFEFLADPPGGPPVMTGHENGVITLNVAEADDAEREKRRAELREPYRTLLGHFRHESGHYYWDRLIRDGDRLCEFRVLFGDEREDYAEAARRHYESGAPGAWQERFLSAYASMHAWEDWAETWAHYLHMTDTLETAASCGLALSPQHPEQPTLDAGAGKPSDFDGMIARWFAVTFALNNLNRGLGLADGYPFVLSPPVVAKLRFVHEIVRAAAG